MGGQFSVYASSTSCDTSHNPIQSFSIVERVSCCHKTSICNLFYIYTLHIGSYLHLIPLSTGRTTRRPSLLNVVLEYNEVGSSLIDTLFRCNNKGWQGGGAMPIFIISSE